MKIKVLILKMSSMGDLIHTLPALTDVVSRFPEVSFDWVVEESFAEIPGWHPAVNKIIPIRLRHWRKNIFKRNFMAQLKEIFSFFKNLRAEKYDLVIDAQGLFKSALVGCLAKRAKNKKSNFLGFFGFDKESVRESGVSFLYPQKIAVPKGLHAITRTRVLFSKIFNYEIDPNQLKFPDYGLLNSGLVGLKKNLKNDSNAPNKSNKSEDQSAFVLFLHGTTWESKHWPEKYWIELGQKVIHHGWSVYLPWGSGVEKDRALRIAEAINLNLAANANAKVKAIVLERLKLTQLAEILQQATYVIGVDSGLAHLAAALECPAITLFGPTDSLLTGPLGKNQRSLQSSFECSPCFLKKCNYPLPHLNQISPPCFRLLPPDKIWEKMLETLEK